MADENSPGSPPSAEIAAFIDAIRSADRAGGVAALRPLLEGAAFAVGHAATRHRMLLRRQARAAKKHGDDSAHAVRLARAAEMQAAVLAETLDAAARVATGFPGKESGVLEAAGFRPEDFQRVGMPWPGGSSGNGQ